MKINSCRGILLMAAWGLITISAEDLSRVRNAIDSEYDKTNGNVSNVGPVLNANATSTIFVWSQSKDEPKNKTKEPLSPEFGKETTKNETEKRAPEAKKASHEHVREETQKSHLRKFSSKYSVKPFIEDDDDDDDDDKKEIPRKVTVNADDDDEGELEELNEEEDGEAEASNEKEAGKEDAEEYEENEDGKQEITKEDEEESVKEKLDETDTHDEKRIKEIHTNYVKPIKSIEHRDKKTEVTIEVYPPSERRADYYPANYIVTSGAKISSLPNYYNQNDLARDQSRYYWKNNNKRIETTTVPAEKEDYDTNSRPNDQSRHYWKNNNKRIEITTVPTEKEDYDTDSRPNDQSRYYWKNNNKRIETATVSAEKEDYGTDSRPNDQSRHYWKNNNKRIGTTTAPTEKEDTDTNSRPNEQPRYYWKNNNKRIETATAPAEKEDYDADSRPIEREDYDTNSLSKEEAEEISETDDATHPYENPEPVSFSSVVYNPDGESTSELSGSYYDELPLTIRIPLTDERRQKNNEDENENQEIEAEERSENSLENSRSVPYTTPVPTHQVSIQTPLSEIKHVEPSVRYTHPPPINFESLTNWYNPELSYNQLNKPNFQIPNPPVYSKRPTTKEPESGREYTNEYVIRHPNSKPSYYPKTTYPLQESKPPSSLKKYPHSELEEAKPAPSNIDRPRNFGNTDRRPRPSPYINKESKPFHEPIYRPKPITTIPPPLNSQNKYSESKYKHQRHSPNEIKVHPNYKEKENFRFTTPSDPKISSQKLRPVIRDHRYYNRTYVPKEQPGEKYTSSQHKPKFREETDSSVHSRRPQKFTNTELEENEQVIEEERQPEPEQKQEREPDREREELNDEADENEEIREEEDPDDNEKFEYPVSEIFKSENYSPSSFKSLSENDELYNQVLANIEALFGTRTHAIKKPKSESFVPETFVPEPLIPVDYQSFLKPRFEQNSFENLYKHEKNDDEEELEDNEELREENEDDSNEELVEDEEEVDEDADGNNNIQQIHVDPKDSDSKNDHRYKAATPRPLRQQESKEKENVNKENEYQRPPHRLIEPINTPYKYIVLRKPEQVKVVEKPKYLDKPRDGYVSPGHQKVVKVYVPKIVMKDSIAIPTNHKRLNI